MSFKAPIAGIINALGTEVTLTNPGTATYDPATGAVTEGAGASVTTKADVMPTKRRIELAIADGDLGLTIPVQDSFVISTKTTAVHNGVKYQVAAVDGLYAFNQLVALEIQLRRVGDG